MRKRYPSTQSMVTFLQVARAGSFSAAARNLNLTHSAVSQQIRTLEGHVGQVLFIRGQRHLELTRAGRVFARNLPDGLDRIDYALSCVNADAQPPGKLIVEVDNELAQAWLNPRLGQLLAGLPAQKLQFQSLLRPEQSSVHGADVSLRYGYGDWQDNEFVRLRQDSVIAVAAPALLTRHGLAAPLVPAQLAELPKLGYTRRTWIPWAESAGLAPVEPDSIATFDNVANLVAAAEAGLGVGLVRRLLAHDGLRAGRLLALTPVAIPAQYNLYALWSPGSGERVAGVVDAVRQLLRDSG